MEIYGKITNINFIILRMVSFRTVNGCSGIWSSEETQNNYFCKLGGCATVYDTECIEGEVLNVLMLP